MNIISFEVLGLPKPQGRPRAVSRGKFASVYSEKTEWRNQVTLEARKRSSKNPEAIDDNSYFDGPINVMISYWFKRPKNHYRTGKYSHLLKDSAPHYCCNKYDLDNLDKAVLDAFTDAELISDDKIVCCLTSSKNWCDNNVNENINRPQGILVLINEMEAV